jgi:hypothetical protein
MTRNEFLLELDEVMETPPGSLKGTEKIEDLEGWNSTAMIGFIALADTNNGARISPRDILKCSTVNDLLALAKVEG